MIRTFSSNDGYRELALYVLRGQELAAKAEAMTDYDLELFGQQLWSNFRYSLDSNGLERKANSFNPSGRGYSFCCDTDEEKEMADEIFEKMAKELREKVTDSTTP